MKGKGEKGRYAQVNTEFQRIAGRDKKAFLNEQCKEIEENSRMGKREFFKKTKDIKRIFHGKIGTIKTHGNGKGLTEAEEIKKRWQEYTELYQKVLMTQISMMV